jgi:hypothetical protein
MPRFEEESLGESSSSTNAAAAAVSTSRRAGRGNRSLVGDNIKKRSVGGGSSSSGQETAGGGEGREEGLLARLQTPEALTYMRYFVIFNSLFILFVMAWPHLIQALNGYSHQQHQHQQH